CLFVCVNVGRGDVAIRTDDWRVLKRIAPCEPLEFVLRKALRIANYAAFASTIRYADSRALPRHPRCECFDFIERYVWVITNATFGWTTRDIVLHTITFEYLHVAALTARALSNLLLC